DTDTCEFLKNHSEIGPFTQVPRTASLSADLEQFVSRWTPGRQEYIADFTHSEKPPAGAKLLSGQEVRELTALTGNEQCRNYIKERDPDQASVIAVAYSIVTPVSSAMVQGESNATPLVAAPSDGVGHFRNVRRAMPKLQGATNGTIGPQMD